VRFLLDVSGGGLVWLSLQPGARLNALETVSRRILATHGELFLLEVKKSVRTHLLKIREQGFDHSASSQVVGITHIGVPVFDTVGAILAVLTVSSFRMKEVLKEPRSLVSALMASSQELTELLYIGKEAGGASLSRGIGVLACE
jgi:DNA-binding IclR family transcriptional regulator